MADAYTSGYRKPSGTNKKKPSNKYPSGYGR